MIPFWVYNRTYVTKKSILALERKFSEIEQNPSKFYDEINIKLLNTSEKKYRAFVPVQGFKAFNIPFTFSTTTMIVQLFEYGGKTKIRVRIKPNYIYLLMFILSVTGFVFNFFWKKTDSTLEGVIIYILCILAAIIIDRISKKILQGTFERFIK